ncbi:MAG TPA: 3-hydroxyacyl-CoA dehydrogenase/enoyl-CoA hydratase family protein [Candidatus Poseidoniales archaeon]|nr:3-hydroxyacyl-CoA dehydrogenase/enoyl-CoA hydratase family protein [Candidatus Poseidoniales archaeon]HIL49860.1 3-hydroxyacyl-CoA dehydrogenase/enoyl-CoA hydratase family protein [Candidatus Poseidoniales archaeon]
MAGGPSMRTVESIAIIGAGNMGSGIAQKSAQELYDVQMVDREAQWVERGQKIIADFLAEAIERRIFRPAEVDAIKSRVRSVVGTENVDPTTDLVIEAVFEDFDVKTAVFATLDEVCDEHTILASNTSSLSVNELAEATRRPDRFVGLHFFFHPAKNRLIEIIPAESTSAATLSAVEQYCKTMGKVVIVCKDRPGFVVNRFFVPWLNEACLLLDEGVGTMAQIDAVARDAFRIGLGPFALMNLTGPTIALHATDYLAEQLDTVRYTGAASLRELVSSGEMWQIGDETESGEEASRVIRERLLGQVFAVSAQIVEEDICSKEDVDRGAKVGLRWARGPFELANRLGVGEAVRMAEAYSDLAGFELPEWFANLSAPMQFSLVDVVVEDGVATVRLNRPEAMNALNETLVAQLGAALDELNAREDVSTIILEGAGKAFVAGADVKFFVDKIRADAISDIYDFTAFGHEVLGKLENSDKITIALTTGLALGGGLELALACDYRIGTRRTQFRFPETSIGIYPGLGGTQRTPRICGIEAARFAILAGNFLDAGSAAALGLLTHLVEASDVASTVDELVESGKPTDKYPAAPADSTHPTAAFALAFYSNENMATLTAGECPEGFDAADKMVSRQLKSLSRTAPIALALASELLDGAVETGDDLDAGLALELAGLTELFGTADALEGLSALIESRRPTYQNT